MTAMSDGSMFSRKRRAVIQATGMAVPARVMYNHELEKMVETSDEWITTRTGIRQRHIAGAEETTATLAARAAQQALARAGMKGEEIDLIVCATITPEMVFPATACFVQHAINNTHCCAFDLAAACSGYTYAMGIASSMLATGQYNKALVVAAETLSTITNYQDRTSCILFGDGAGVTVLKAQEDTDRGMLYFSLHADGGGWETLSCQAYGSRNPVSRPLASPDLAYMQIRGRETYQLAVRRIVELIEESYRKLGISNDDVAMVIPHQMNARIIESVIKRLALPEEKMFVNIDRYGNTSSASIAIALDEAVQQGKLKQGDVVVLVAFGAGLTWGVNVIRM